MFSVFAGASIGATGVGYAAWRVFWRPTERVLSGTSELATLYRAWWYLACPPFCARHR